MVRFIPLFIYLYIYLLISFFLEQKQANIGFGQWGMRGWGGGGKAVLQYHRLYWYVPL